jgi:hypothetical protein
MFDPCKPFQPSLIFTSKASGASLKRFTNNKHFSQYSRRISDEEKSFITSTPGNIFDDEVAADHSPGTLRPLVENLESHLKIFPSNYALSALTKPGYALLC